MSDSQNQDGGEAPRTPDQFVKRAPTVANTTVMGTGGSALGLAALYINQCLTADALVVPSTEMIIVIIGLLFPAAHLVWRVGAKKMKDWAARQGVDVLLIAGAMLGLGACANAQVNGDQAKFDRACGYANGVLSAGEPVIPIAEALLRARFGAEAGLAFTSFVETIRATCGAPLDISNAGAVIQRVYDAGGNIAALIVKAQAPE